MSDVPSGEYIRCQYLGKVEDREAVYNQATRRHRCYRWDRPQPIRRQDQEHYCLSPLHVTCPRLSDPAALPVPDGKRRRHRRTQRVFGVPVQRLAGYLVPMVLLLVVAVVASVFLVRQLAAAPLPTVSIAEAATPGSVTATATPTLYPTWTPIPPPATDTPPPTETSTETPTPTATASPTAFLTSTPTLTPVATPRPTSTHAPTATVDGSTFTSPLATPTGSTFTSPVQTPNATATAAAQSAAGYDFAVFGEPAKTLVPGGVDVCAKVYGRVYDMSGNIITNTVGVAVDWWPNNRIEVGTEGNAPINADGTYEFCLTRGQFNVSIVARKRTSEVLWIDLDEPAFTGQVILEINWRLIR